MKRISDSIIDSRTDPTLFIPVTLSDTSRISSLIIIFVDNPLKPSYNKSLSISSY